EVQADSLPDLAEEPDALEDLLLGLLAEARQLGDQVALAGHLEALDAIRPEFEEGLHLLRTEARQPEHLDHPRRDRGAELLQVREFPSGHECADLLLEGFADAADLAELLLLDQLLEVSLELADGASAVVVGVGAECVLALDSQQSADLVEGVRDFVL